MKQIQQNEHMQMKLYTIHTANISLIRGLFNEYALMQ